MIRRYHTLPFVAAIALLSAPAAAENFGLLNGRSANLTELPDTSVEVGFVTGDIAIDDIEDDYRHIGGRLNYRLAPDMMLLADIGQADIDGDDGIVYGLGVFYQTQGIFPTTDFTLKVSYHLGEIDIDRSREDADVSGLTFEGLFSGKEPIGESALRWYANVGVHRLEAEADGFVDQSGTEIGFGGGVFADTGTGAGQFYGGIDLIDEMSFGVGYRHFLN